MRTKVPHILVLFATACGDTGPSADELNAMLTNTSGTGSTAEPGASAPTGGTGTPVSTPMNTATPSSPMPATPTGPGPTSGPANPAGGGGTPNQPTAEPNPGPEAGGTPSNPAAGGTPNVPDPSGTPSVPEGSGGTVMAAGGTGGVPVVLPVGGAPPVSTGGTPGVAGMGGEVLPPGPYDARSGSFKMLVYSKTAGFRHDSAINNGKTMLQQIATEQGFEVTFTEQDDLITVDGLSQFEIVFFLNSTGDIFDNTEQDAYQQWMTEHNGAFAGVHSATDTEAGWSFYSDVTGQYYDGHGNANTPDQIQLEPTMLTFPALVGLPNPWQRNEEWYKFNNFQSWSVQPGFQILGRKAADAQPIMWIREWSNFRAFYTAIGHDGSVFNNDNDVKRHLTGGIMWAVRREHLIQ